MRNFTPCLVFFLLFLAGCGGGSGNPGNEGRASFTVHWPNRSRLIPAASESIKVSISNPQGQVVATNLMQRPASGGDVTVTISPLPVGDLPVSAVAYPNADGTGTAQGTASLILHSVAGQVQSITLTLNSTVASMELTATSLNVPVGGHQQLNAAAKDANGAVVLTIPSTISWQSSNTSVATVEGTGKVTGVSVGTANITVTESESGKSKTVPVSVGNPLGSTGTITIARVSQFTWGVFTMQGDGSGLTKVSGNLDEARQYLSPILSPNRQYVLFGTHTGAGLIDVLHLSQASGAGRIDLGVGGYPSWAWSPDSTRVVFNGDNQGTGFGEMGLYVMSVPGGAPTKIGSGQSPQWSPDGTKIVADDFSTGKLFFILPDGTGRQDLVTGCSAKWFPNSRKLAFLRGQALYTVNDDGTGETLVSNGEVGSFDISPDGTRIVFSYHNGTAWQVKMYTAGGAANQIASGYLPVWSPDGAKIAYIQSGSLHFVNPDGSGDFEMPNTSGISGLDWQ